MKNNQYINITKTDIVWNYVGSILNIGMNVFLLPLLLRILPSNDLGLWYVFTSISGLIVLIDFGFSPTISRNVTLAWCGARELSKDGLSNIEFGEGNTNYNLLKSLLNVSKKIYSWISIIALLVLLMFGTIFVYSLINKYNNTYYYILTWIVYAFSIVLNMYFSYWNSFLRGIGALKQLNIATIYSRLLFIIISIVGLVLGGGLFSIAIAQIISGLVLRLLCRKEFLHKAGTNLLTIQNETNILDNVVLRQLLPNSTKYGVVSIGGFLSQRADILLCSSFLGLEVTSSYGLTMQLFNLLGSISQLLFSSYASQITQEKFKGNKNKDIALFSISIAFQFIIGIFGILIIVIFGPFLLSKIGTSSVLLSKDYLLLIGVILLFEWNNSVIHNYLMASNRIPFLSNAIFSGIFVVLCSFMFLFFTDLGIFSLLIGRIVIGFGLNNWYWIWYISKDLGVGFFGLLFDGFVIIYTSLMKSIYVILNRIAK